MNFLLHRCHTNLLIVVCLAYACGIVLSGQAAVADPLPGAAALIFWLLTLLAWLRRHPAATLVFLILCFLALGCWRATVDRSISVSDGELAHLAATTPDTVVVGVLDRLVTGDATGSKAVIAIHRVNLPRQHALIPMAGRVLLTVKGTWPPTIKPGDNLVVRATLRLPPTATTPGTFDYRRYLAGRQIAAVGTVASPLFIQPLIDSSAAADPTISRRIERLRTAIAARIDTVLPGETGALYRALLIGDRSALAPQTMESFKGAGVMHILAISGLHLGLLTFFLFHVIYWLMRRSTRLLLNLDAKKLSMVLCIPPLLSYTLLAGAQPPVLRSFIMTLFVVVALASDRLRSPFTVLAGAALFILLFAPLTLMSASFQLSFAAVGGIVLIATPVWRRFETTTPSTPSRRRTVYRWLLTGVAVSGAATIATAPLLLYHFNRLATTGIAANLVVEPLVCFWAMPFGFVALAVLPIAPQLADFCLQAGTGALSAALHVSMFFSELRWSTVWLPAPPIWAIACYYGSLLLLFAGPPRPRRTGTALLLLSVCLMSFFHPLTGIMDTFRSNDRISFIDVGHGSSVLIELTDGRTLLADSGCRSSPGFDCGAAIIAPYLWHRRIARVDDIIVSHADADHYNGIPALLSRFRVRRLWLPYLDEHKQGYDELCRLAKERGVELHFPEGGQFIETTHHRLMVLGAATGPPQQRMWSRAPAATEDDNGLVISMQTPTFSVLLPGDIGVAREQELLAAGEQVQADILLSPHHGSATSNSAAFLAAVAPRYLIVSTGDRTRGLFPSAELRSYAEATGITLLTTADNGTIVVTGTADGYRVDTFRQLTGRDRAGQTEAAASDFGKVGRRFAQEFEEL